MSAGIALVLAGVWVIFQTAVGALPTKLHLAS